MPNVQAACQWANQANKQIVWGLAWQACFQKKPLFENQIFGELKLTIFNENIV